MAAPLLSVQGLEKTFRKPFTRRKVEAVRGISLEVLPGEIFGFLGPNGAGKTTTIKMLVGLIAPTRGEATLFGLPIPAPEAMKRVGFLPENPYIYPYLTAREFVTLCARLSGVKPAGLKKKVEEVIRRVGVEHAMDRPVRTYSKGMTQRVGLAAALVHDPELLILDEPMSGLDPVGRKEVRDLILEEKRAGKTVFFSSHILSDVEMLCTRVSILRKGEVVVSGVLSELLSQDKRHTEVSVEGASPEVENQLAALGTHGHTSGDLAVFEVEGEGPLRRFLELALREGVKIRSVIPKRETLEDVFVRKAL